MPDLIGRRFAPGDADVAWVGDITYIPTGEGWLYLASVLDLGSRRWLGYSMADHMRTDLVADTFDMAVATRGGRVTGTIFHGDRGSQYMSHDYREQVVGYGMIQSVGRTGVCWDNAVAESAWSSLKRELVHRYRFATRAEARRAIFAWINRYNSSRRHSTLATSPPSPGSSNTLNPRPTRPRNQRDRPTGGSSGGAGTRKRRRPRRPKPTGSCRESGSADQTHFPGSVNVTSPAVETSTLPDGSTMSLAACSVPSVEPPLAGSATASPAATAAV
jgi:Integrase core domain